MALENELVLQKTSQFSRKGAPTGGSETNFEFDFYENLVTEAIATLAHLSRAVAKLGTPAVEARPPAPLNGNPKANCEAQFGLALGA